MKIAILSRNAKLYSTRRLLEAATHRGHKPKTRDTLRSGVAAMRRVADRVLTGITHAPTRLAAYP